MQESLFRFDFFICEAYHLIYVTANYTLHNKNEMREQIVCDFLGRMGDTSLCNLILEFGLMSSEDISMKHVDKHKNLKQFWMAINSPKAKILKKQTNLNLIQVL